MKTNIIIGLLFFVSAIAYKHMTKTTLPDQSLSDKICLDGVVYWNKYNKLAVAMDTNSTVQLCKDWVSQEVPVSDIDIGYR